jgi:hypothetical protein
VTRAAIVGIALASTACLVEPNPDFIDPTAGDGTGDTGSSMCPAGTLDCDGEPGCEADASDPYSCGSCDHVCELAGELLECVAGQCTGTVMFTDFPDAYVDRNLPDQNFGSEPSLLIDAARDSYLELPDITVPSNAQFESVALHLSCSQPGALIDVYRIETGVDEPLVTEATAPTLNNELIASVTPVVGDNVVELVGLLPSWRSGNPKRSLGLRSDPDAGPDPTLVEFSSREGSSPPYLMVTLRW